MKLLTTNRCAVLALALLVACSGPVEDTRPGQPVKHRQDGFKTMMRAFEPMGVMLRERKYDPERFVVLAGELVAARDVPWSYFAPDTLYPPTKARAEVWTRADRFEAEREQFFSATDALLAAAQAREEGAVRTAYEKVYDSCKSCHQDFKVK